MFFFEVPRSLDATGAVFRGCAKRFELGGIDEITLSVAHEQADQNVERLAWLQNAIACKHHCDTPTMEMPRSRRRSQDSCNAQGHSLGAAGIKLCDLTSSELVIEKLLEAKPLLGNPISFAP